MSRVFSYFFGQINAATVGTAAGFVAWGLGHVESPENFAFNATCIVLGCLTLVWEGALYLDGR